MALLTLLVIISEVKRAKPTEGAPCIYSSQVLSFCVFKTDNQTRTTHAILHTFF